MEETFLLLLLSYAPHPNPLPKGEGIYTLDLGALGGLMRTEIV